MNRIKEYHSILGALVANGEVRVAQFFVENKEALEVYAASLGRVFQHIAKKGISSWGIVTSYRGALSKQENEKSFQKLKTDVRSRGYGFFVVSGIGQEEDGGKSVEPAIFIPGIKQKDIQLLSNKYDQYAYVYSGPEVEGKIVLVSKDGTQSLGRFHPMKIAQFYSKVKGKPFVFADVLSDSNMERYDRFLRSGSKQVLRDPE